MPLMPFYSIQWHLTGLARCQGAYMNTHIIKVSKIHVNGSTYIIKHNKTIHHVGSWITQEVSKRLVNGLYHQYTLTIDPNFLGHPGSSLLLGIACSML